MISEKISRIDSEFSDIAEAVRNGQGYIGKNRLPNNITSKTIDGVKIIVNEDKSFIVNGTPTATIQINLITDNSNQQDFILEKGDYILNGAPYSDNNSIDGASYKLDIRTSSDLAYEDYGTGVNISLNENVTFNRYRVVLYGGKTFNNLLFKPMLRLSSAIDDNYEPPCHYKPREISDAIFDMVENFYKFLPTKKVIDGVCENAVNLPIVQFSTDGNSNQKTTDGTNLCDLNVSQLNNVTYNLDGTIKINRSGGFALNFKDYNFKANTTYYMKWELVSGSINYIDEVFLSPNGKTWSKQGVFTLFKFDTDIVKKSFWASASATFTNAVIRIWFSESQSDFEEYTGGQSSPNPDYPQDIEVIDTVNLFDKDKVISNSSYVGEIGQNIAITTNAVTFRATKIVANSNSITIGANKTSGIFRVKLTDSDDIIRYNQTFSTLPQTIDTTTYKNIYIYFDKTTITIDNDIQITLGTISKPYLPYGYIGIEQAGKNKINLNNATIDLKNGGKAVVYNQIININGTITKSGNETISNIDYVLKKDKIYTLVVYGSGSIDESALSDCSILLGNSEKTNYITANITDGIKLKNYTPSQDIKLTILNLYNNANLTSINMEVKVMLLEGEFSIQNLGVYEPYHKPIIYPINLNGNVLAKVGNIFDVLNIYRNGKVTLSKNIEKVILDGSESIYDSSGTSSTIKQYNITNYPKGLFKNDTNYYVISNYFKSNKWDGSWLIDNCIVITSDGFVRIMNSENTTIEEFKNWLSIHKPKVIYLLKNPTTIELPSIKPIKNWEGTNIFSLITNLDTDYSVEYVVDKNNIVNESEEG